uniref:ubiquitin-conjugating enzyme E2 R1 isoform X2 n=1 Tax=Ictidomys tridecemlineatus TaxID=43179 RepID=UPI001A9FB68C|nr:ubiquitin-conjugating enzyme E2 R1 isoform X2 [Ictidomys tridecemlineatus]
MSGCFCCWEQGAEGCPPDCQILPYVTKNMGHSQGGFLHRTDLSLVKALDSSKGHRTLFWSQRSKTGVSLPKARLKFPIDYPYSPPAFRFLTKMWHPNIYETGDVCISILHPPVDDPQSGELPSERWNPTQNVRKQVLGTKVDAERDGVKVPTTLAEYCVKTKAPAPEEGADLFYEDYYEDGEVEEADSCFGDDEDDSGTEES